MWVHSCLIRTRISFASNVIDSLRNSLSMWPLAIISEVERVYNCGLSISMIESQSDRAISRSCVENRMHLPSSCASLFKEQAEFVAVGQVQKSGWFVKQDDGGILCEGTRYHDSLALAVGHFIHCLFLRSRSCRPVAWHCPPGFGLPVVTVRSSWCRGHGPMLLRLCSADWRCVLYRWLQS